MPPCSRVKTLPGTAEEGLVVMSIFGRERPALQPANSYGLGRKLLLAGIGLNGRAAPDVQACKRLQAWTSGAARPLRPMPASRSFRPRPYEFAGCSAGRSRPKIDMTTRPSSAVPGRVFTRLQGGIAVLFLKIENISILRNRIKPARPLTRYIRCRAYSSKLKNFRF